MWHSETEAEENLFVLRLFLDLWVILKEAPSHNRIWGNSAWMQIHDEFMPPEKKAPRESASLTIRGIKAVPLTCKESLSCPAKKDYWLCLKILASGLPSKML